MDPLVNGQSSNSRRSGVTHINVNHNGYSSRSGINSSSRAATGGMSRGQTATSRVREIPLDGDTPFDDLENGIEGINDSPNLPTGRRSAPSQNPAQASKPKSSKGHTALKAIMTIFIAIALLILGAAGGVYFDRNVLLKETTSYEDEPAVSRDELNTGLTPEEETELSDKISYLNLSENMGEYITSDYYRVFSDLVKNDLSAAQKVMISVLSLRDQFQTLEEPAYETFTSSVSADLVSERYLSIFGETPTMTDGDSDISAELCPGYRYDQAAGLVYIGSGCGGTSFDYDMIYKEKYELDGDTAYAYLRVGSMNLNPDDAERGIYNDYFTSETKTVYLTAADFTTEDEFTNFQINAENADNFSEYRVSFQKNENGEFSLGSVEKL